MPEVIYSLTRKRVYVAGHRGMVGSAIVRRLASEGCEILTSTRAEVDLRRQDQVEAWMSKHRPDAVFLAAARVGGILANATYPADFLYDNLILQANVIHAAHRTHVQKLMFLGSSCIYPKFADQPIVEDSLLTGSLEPTNEWYAIAKIAGLKLCQAYRKQHGRDFISAMPTNLYGPGDNFDLGSSHVMPALIRKTHEAKVSEQQEICVWGTGTPRREFLHVDDCADACLHLMKTYSAESHVNVGCGEDITILELAYLVSKIVGFEGKITRDLTKPDGTPRKLLSVDKLRSLGWSPKIGLNEGIADAYRSFLDGHHLERSDRAVSSDLIGQSDISFEKAKSSAPHAPTLSTVAHHPSP
ncbi:GDP-L-fucose synthase family protein [Rhizobium leguminosarum]|uniref:GDP-L-fucose synthase n=1 Tax=Rhizobium leguminosarum TaxID=384 RepID=UPI001C906AAC|nr:GDP-L-fucose synthase [Rhizobium leguminosarum]MBY2919539.1 GDP-L-fucose synthase [Rhizobium leguminosarum]MBY2975146.1 GDP-L-fucose synthase [Rhizobium leguminosarum]MBY2982580.1 GDP-L-fucose synthase [Rhizobium leguminosarum]MBY3001245.1 GDP-L-fucose synthase [Rhizobium leguminosarum]MBY3011094.1 GDP-L-fucose synthase [Rhizobium leguminosarum]